MRDKIIKDVIEKFKERSDVGYKKYGVTLHDDEPSLHKWLNHLQEELMDAINYIQKLKMETSDALEEKILKDYEEEDSFSKYSNPERWTEDRTW
jgi:DNA anti-recombination protein RmuC|tara:strand:- start:2903 stop:3184 length:282 start_codon:yes stop_codon:yes gene_type:complete